MNKKISSNADDALVEVELEDLPVRVTSVGNINLWRSPSWSELFFAIHEVIRNLEESFFETGNTVIAINPNDTDGGRCALHAGITWAFLSMLVDLPVGVGLGGAIIKCSDQEDHYITLPADPFHPEPFSGG